MSSTKTIAIVEDDEILREIYVFILEQNGFQTLTAIDGDSALKLIEEKNPDLVLLDLMMPGISGEEVVNQLRKTSFGKSLKIIVLTNIGHSKTTKDLKKMGVLEVVTKVDKTPQEIADLVASHL